MTTKTRRLGRSEIEVAPLMFGGNIFGWTVDEPTSFLLLDAFLAEGFNFVDTADVYSKWVPGNKGGESETIIGKWMKQSGNRSKIILATKVGMELGPTEKGLSKSYILRAVEKSLQRLQTDYIDLYQSHQDDPATPLEETLDAYAQLIREGKVRVIGASNYTAERLAQALQVSEATGLPRYESLQPLYNLCDRKQFEEALEPLCLKEGLGVVTYFSLASGFLSGKYRTEADFSQSKRGESVKKHMNARGLRILSALDQVALQHNSTPARVALAWLIARPSVTAPIASATTLEQLNDLVESTRLTLSPAAIERLNQASAG